jgi:hypothetical protein
VYYIFVATKDNFDDNRKLIYGRETRRWTQEEIEFLKNNYIEKGAKFVADQVERGW